MTEQALLEAEPTAVPTDSKWTAGISPDRPVCEVADLVLPPASRPFTTFFPWPPKRATKITSTSISFASRCDGPSKR